MDIFDDLPIILAIFFLVIYILPSVIAFYRNHEYKWFIAGINIILGFSGGGWIIAFTWAVWPKHKSVLKSTHSKSQSKDNNSEGNNSQREFHNSNLVIVSCLLCDQKIRLIMPHSKNEVTCPKCFSLFKLGFTDDGKIYIIETIDSKYRDKSETKLYSIDQCFILLEVNSQASSSAIKAAYKKKIMQYHPDKVENLGPLLKKVAEEETKKINAAYSFLQKNGLV